MNEVTVATVVVHGFQDVSSDTWSLGCGDLVSSLAVDVVDGGVEVQSPSETSKDGLGCVTFPLSDLSA